MFRSALSELLNTELSLKEGRAKNKQKAWASCPQRSMSIAHRRHSVCADTRRPSGPKRATHPPSAGRRLAQRPTGLCAPAGCVQSAVEVIGERPPFRKSVRRGKRPRTVPDGSLEHDSTCGHATPFASTTRCVELANTRRWPAHAVRPSLTQAPPSGGDTHGDPRTLRGSVDCGSSSAALRFAACPATLGCRRRLAASETL